MSMADRYIDAEPDEAVSSGGRTVSLRTAVREWVKVRGTPGIRAPFFTRDIGKQPATLGASELDDLAELERFR
jgi:hypothetical protein